MTSLYRCLWNLPPLGRPLKRRLDFSNHIRIHGKRLGEMSGRDTNELYDLDCIVSPLSAARVYGPRMFDASSKAKTATSDRLGVAIRVLSKTERSVVPAKFPKRIT